MIKIKNILSIIVTVVVIFIIYINYDKIYDYVYNYLVPSKEIIIHDINKYQKNYEFEFISNVKDFKPENKEDVLNIFYTVLNNGWDEFTFYCPDDYKDCLEDVKAIGDDEVLLSKLNDYVSPFNSYSTYKTIYDSTGEVTLKVKHTYSYTEIERINKDIDKIISENITNDMSNYDKILVMHDYIINNTKYDTLRDKNGESKYDSERITGLLYEHYSICSGYADTMSVILDKLNIPNFRISSTTHVWNAVYIDGEWYHLDLTWDDPVTTSGEDRITHDYFLIDNDKLEDLTSSTDEHKFSLNFYPLFK